MDPASIIRLIEVGLNIFEKYQQYQKIEIEKLLLSQDYNAAKQFFNDAAHAKKEYDSIKYINNAREHFTLAVQVTKGYEKIHSLLGRAICFRILGDEENFEKTLDDILNEPPVIEEKYYLWEELKRNLGLYLIDPITRPFLIVNPFFSIVMSPIIFKIRMKTDKRYRELCTKLFAVAAINKSEAAKKAVTIQIAVSKVTRKDVKWIASIGMSGEQIRNLINDERGAWL